jgi:putative cell wall-binding protein
VVLSAGIPSTGTAATPAATTATGVNATIVLGGKGVISQAVEDEVNRLTGAGSSDRIAGKDRYETQV